MPLIKRIHHVAILIEDIDAALHFWRDLLGLEPVSVVDIPHENARIAFLPVAESEIELVQPSTTDSGISRFLEKHGPGMHHLCFEVADLQSFLVNLKAKGVQLINEQPKLGEDGRLYAFIHPKSTNGVLVELYQPSS
jgi:methylmalonyl-CoA/ethylmalonyl-CoA epimerase